MMAGELATIGTSVSLSCAQVKAALSHQVSWRAVVTVMQPVQSAAQFTSVSPASQVPSALHGQSAAQSALVSSVSAQSGVALHAPCSVAGSTSRTK